MKKQKQMILKVDEKLHWALKAGAALEQKNVSEVLRELIVAWMKKKHPEILPADLGGKE